MIDRIKRILGNFHSQYAINAGIVDGSEGNVGVYGKEARALLDEIQRSSNSTREQIGDLKRILALETQERKATDQSAAEAREKLSVQIDEICRASSRMRSDVDGMRHDLGDVMSTVKDMQPVVGSWAQTTNAARLTFRTVISLSALVAAILGVAAAIQSAIKQGWHLVVLHLFK